MIGSEKRRALNAPRPDWQPAPGRSGLLHVGSVGAVMLALGAAPCPAQANQIQTLPLGAYSCELPGDALHSAGRRLASEDFAIVHSSTYASAGRQGSYLLTGNIIAMTSGPLAGGKYHRISDNFLRKLGADGTDSELRCIRRLTNERQ